MSPFFGDVFVTLCVFAFALIIRSRSSGSRLWFLLAFKKFLLVLRARPVFPAVIGFSWPSRSPLQVGSILGVFYPEPLFRYDVFVVSRASCACLAFSSQVCKSLCSLHCFFLCLILLDLAACSHLWLLLAVSRSFSSFYEFVPLFLLRLVSLGFQEILMQAGSSLG